uniref:Tc1-like transposase DDE domain-containing protein n=1 Tax=Phytophthora ramorum TaxID=164328 RepID=H3GYP0_PHYRM
MAYRIVDTGRVENLPRGGAQPGVAKTTPQVKELLGSYLNDSCAYTMEIMHHMLVLNLGLEVSTSTISRHLLGVLYAIKQTRVEPATCNNLTNKTKRREFAKKLKQHQREVVLHRLERGSTRMVQNSQFISDIYDTVKGSEFFRENYDGKTIVVVLDNAPAHRQTEERVTAHDDLCLGPYSPMCNPIEVRRIIKYIAPAVVTNMELHARDAVNAAAAMKDMVYGK